VFLSDISVKRPVGAIVLSLLLVVFGYISFTNLPVRELPDMDNPVVSVSTTYRGASADIIESQVTAIIEAQLSGISGIDEITSTSRANSSRITVTFLYSHDINEGLSDVREAVSQAQRHLPSDADAPIIAKSNAQGQGSMYISFTSETMDRTQLTDYADRVLVDRFDLIDGVSAVSINGALKKVMYVQLSPELMAGRNVSVTDISNALRTENLEAPGGEIRNDTLTMSVRTERSYNAVEDFKYLKVKTASDGTSIYLQDVADVYEGAENENSIYTSNGAAAVGLGVEVQSDANPLQVATKVHEEVEKVRPFLPSGSELRVDYDSTVFIERSVEEVYSTLMITGGLVVLVLYIFIGQARATLIPAITVPISLITAFTVAYFMGYSINLITLMALILAIGLVVDDAIVVIENMFHHIEQGETPLVAAFKGAREVGFAVISTTVVLASVFLPITFMEGQIGLIFTEFAVVLSAAVIASSLVALTLAPVLGSKLFKQTNNVNWVSQLVNTVFGRLESGYRWLLKGAIKLRWIGPLIIIGCMYGTYQISTIVPAQLFPTEDRGVVFMMVRGAESSSFNRMAGNIDDIETRLQPLLEQGFIKGYSSQTPAFGGNSGDNIGFIIIPLDDWNDRDHTAAEVTNMLRGAMGDIIDVRAIPMQPGMRGGTDEAVKYVLGGPDYSELSLWADKLQHIAEDSPFMEGASVDYSESTPEVVISIDKQRAAALGISYADISNTLNVILGGSSITTYVERGEEYDVYLRGSENSFNSSADLSQVYLRTQTGAIVTLDTVASTEIVASAARLNHLNKQKVVTLSASVSDGYTLGQALDFLDQQAIELLPADITINYSGESKDYKENQTSTMVVFALALLIAYLILAAQFESFVSPLVVMFTVPMGILGGFIGIMLLDQSLNMYTQIGMIMLIGMVTKNGILIVEFANQLRDQGQTFEQATINAASRRLRPIMMTAFTTLAGAIPLILSSGAGFESRVAVGTVIFFGMAFSTLVSLFVIPMMYRLLSARTKSPEYVTRQLEQQLRKLDSATTN
jgi:HAE1 family hydrophobic/amphiphilic exporter-1